MQWHDSLYGSWELPEAVARLVLTDRAVRMQDISLSLLPNFFMTHGPMPNRFQHGLGVCRLATEAVAANPDLDERYRILLPVAAFLHDAGSPPFSHLCEPFLERDYGHDGESFLTAMLRGSQTADALDALGFSVEEVTALVCGKDEPMSEVLCGTLDVDNADNVARYWVFGDHSPAGYDPLAIARSYRYDPRQRRWALLSECFEEAQAWKDCRERVYSRLIYTNPAWSVGAMVQRALFLHWKHAGKLPLEFYFLSDKEASLELLASPVAEARELMAQAARRAVFVPVVMHKLEGDVPERLRTLSGDDTLYRHILADRVAAELGIPAHHVCAAVGKSRDRRKITMPFLRPDGVFYGTDDGPSAPVYRASVWVHPDHAHRADQVAQVVRETLF
jgi:HD superfamily phosphohydrolase